MAEMGKINSGRPTLWERRRSGTLFFLFETNGDDDDYDDDDDDVFFFFFMFSSHSFFWVFCFCFFFFDVVCGVISVVGVLCCAVLVCWCVSLFAIRFCFSVILLV